VFNRFGTRVPAATMSFTMRYSTFHQDSNIASFSPNLTELDEFILNFNTLKLLFNIPKPKINALESYFVIVRTIPR
jgi:hypothetical protein